MSYQSQIGSGVVQTIPIPTLDIKPETKEHANPAAVQHRQSDHGIHDFVAEPVMLICMTLNKASFISRVNLIDIYIIFFPIIIPIFGIILIFSIDFIFYHFQSNLNQAFEPPVPS